MCFLLFFLFYALFNFVQTHFDSHFILRAFNSFLFVVALFCFSIAGKKKTKFVLLFIKFQHLLPLILQIYVIHDAVYLFIFPNVCSINKHA